MRAPEVSKFFGDLGLDVITSTPAELAAYYRQEIAKYAKLIAAANIKPE